MKIAVTGNRGSGKKTFCEQTEGFDYLDEDTIVNNLMNQGNFVSELKNEFGPNICFIDGKLNIQILMKLLMFPKNISFFNSLLMNYIAPLVLDKLNELEFENEVAIYKSYRLFELGLNSHFDRIVCVSSEKEKRMRRTNLKYSYPDGVLKSIFDTEMPEKYKIQKSDYIIKNNDTMHNFSSYSNVIFKEVLFGCGG